MSVSEYQQFLNDHGYGPLAVDGVNGPKTKAAVKRWQTDHGLKADGVVGPKTTASFGSSGASASASSGSGSVGDEINKQFPEFAWMTSIPELYSTLQQAINGKWPVEQTVQALHQTNWWKSKTDAEVNWLQELATNPAEANRRLQNYDSIQKYMSMSADYGLPVDFSAAAAQVGRVVRGEIPPENLTEELRRQAKALYPQLTTQIDAGSTVADVYAPYKQMASSLLGVNPESINLSDPKWQLPLQQRDKATGAFRLATTDEWQALLRSNPAFGYDQSFNGRQQAAQFATMIGQKFGNIA